MAWQDDLDQIQGFIVRGYRADFIRYFALSVQDAAAARSFLGSLAPAAGPCLVTTAKPWGETKPSHCLNVGFTFRGLRALGAPAATLDSFSSSANYGVFATGSAASATTVGDIGPCDPRLWVVSDQDFDVMLMVSAWTPADLQAASDQLASQFAAGFGAPAADRVFDSQALPDDKVYFGYRDNIAQPIIQGSPFDRGADGPQEEVDPGAFLLGASTGGLFNIPTPAPQALGLYGCFGAFRILKQDVDGFEAQAKALAPTMEKLFGITDPDLQAQAVMAKICGRWPNGTPLTDYWPPVGNQPPPPPQPGKINDFGYSDDPRGMKCPISSHIRRANSRDVSGRMPQNHRIMRRAMPYRNADPQNPEVGLMGLFLGVSFLMQFEFVMQSWINQPTGGVMDQADPMMGLNQTNDGGPFQETLVTDKRPWPTLDMNSFVNTRGSAYVFFPGIPGLRWIASAGQPTAA